MNFFAVIFSLLLQLWPFRHATERVALRRQNRQERLREMMFWFPFVGWVAVVYRDIVRPKWLRLFVVEIRWRNSS